MKTILVPTDFSSTAETAFNYALSLAKNLNNKLILFHAYQVPAPIAELPFAVLNDERRLLKEESERKLKALSKKIQETGNVLHECVLEEGVASEMILKYAKEKNVDLIIMGTTGQSGLSGVVFGSVSLKIMEKANCPVISIPAGFSLNKAIKRITYATDYHNSDVVAINKAVDIAQASGAQLNILHICDAIIGADEEKTLMHDFMEKVKKTTSYPNLSFQIIHGYNVEARLEQYIEDESTDMLMMATHYRSFFDRVFGKSITRNVTRETSIPVVAFHYNAKITVNLY